MRGKRIIMSIIFIFICFGFTGCGHKKTAEDLARYGKEQFIQEVFPVYLARIQEQGVSDLVAEVNTRYNYEVDYDKENKTLHLKCWLANIKSEEIDRYFTTGYNGENEQILADVMKNIRSAYARENYTYILDSVGTVVVQIDKPEHEICISTAAGREYSIVYGYTESVRVEIDDDWVYLADEANTDEIVGEVPYIGMSKKHINHTELGFYDEVEYCPDYNGLRANLRFATYSWYDEAGNVIFSANICGEEVISTVDRRDGKLVSKGP